MIDEIFDRQYQSGRQQLNAGIDQFFSSVGRELGKSLAAVHRFEWNAPWLAKTVKQSKNVKCA